MFDERPDNTRRRSRSRGRRSGEPRALRYWVIVAVNIGVLIVGVMAFRGAVAGAPALSPELRVAPEGADWRPLFRPAFYDQSLYFAERIGAILGQDAGASASPGELMASLALALRAVEAAPADAYQWTLLAAVSAAAGFPEPARAALARSIVLAPYNASLAVERLRLFGLYETPLDATAKATIERDLAVADRFRSRELQALLKEYPAITEAVPLPAPDLGPAGPRPEAG